MDIQQGMQRGAAFVQSLHNLIPSIGALLESGAAPDAVSSVLVRSQILAGAPAAFADTLRPVVAQLVQTVVDGSQVTSTQGSTP